SLLAPSAIQTEWDLGIAGGFNIDSRFELLRQADLVLAFGASLNFYQTRGGELFEGADRVIQVDLAEGATSAIVTDFVRGDARTAALLINEHLEERGEGRWRDALSRAAHGWPLTAPEYDEFGTDGRLDPRAVVRQLDELL